MSIPLATRKEIKESLPKSQAHLEAAGKAIGMVRFMLIAIIVSSIRVERGLLLIHGSGHFPLAPHYFRSLPGLHARAGARHFFRGYPGRKRSWLRAGRPDQCSSRLALGVLPGHAARLAARVILLFPKRSAGARNDGGAPADGVQSGLPAPFADPLLRF